MKSQNEVLVVTMTMLIVFVMPMILGVSMWWLILSFALTLPTCWVGIEIGFFLEDRGWI